MNSTIEDSSRRCVSVPRRVSLGAAAVSAAALLLLTVAHSAAAASFLGLYDGIAVAQLLLAGVTISISYGRNLLARYISGTIGLLTASLLFLWAFNLLPVLAVLRVHLWPGLPLDPSDFDLELLFVLLNTAVCVELLANLRTRFIIHPFLWSIALCTSVVALYLFIGAVAQLRPGQSGSPPDVACVVLILALLLQNVMVLAAVGKHPRGTEWSTYLSVFGFVALTVLGAMLANQLRKSEFRQLRDATAIAAIEVNKSFDGSFASSKTQLLAMLAHWDALDWHVPDDVWMKDIGRYMEDFPNQEAVVEFDAQGSIVRAVVLDEAHDRRPMLTENATAIQHTLGDLDALTKALDEAITTGTIKLSARARVKPRLDAALLPQLDAAKRVHGVLLFLYDPSRLADRVASDVAPEFDVKVTADGDALYSRSTPSMYGDLRSQYMDGFRPSLIETSSWSVQIWPSDVVIKRYLAQWPALPIQLSWAAAIIYALALHYTRRSQSLEADRDRILEQSLDLICTVTAKGEFVTVSAASSRMLGYAPQELEGKVWLDIVHPKDRERANAVMRHVIDGSPVSDLELRCLRRDQTRIYAQWSMRWSSDADMLYCVARDITDSRMNQLRVRDREDVFNRAAEFTGTVVLSWDEASNERYMLGAVERIFGRSPIEPGARRIVSSRVHADEVNAYAAMRDRVLESGGSAYGLYRIKTADGCYGLFDVNMRTWKDERSRIVRRFVMLADVTQRELVNRERRRYTEQLAALAELAGRMISVRAQQELCATIAEAMLDLLLVNQAIVIVEPGGFRESSCACAFARELGVKVEPRPSEAMARLVAGSDEPVRLTSEEVATRAFWQGEHGLSLPAKINGWLAVPLIGRNGTHIGSLHTGDRAEGSFTDADEKVLTQLAGLMAVTLDNVSLRGVLEERVAERTRELELSNRELEAFSYSVSHDLRSPLRAIGGFSGLLRQDYADVLPPEGLNFLVRIEDGVRRMGDLIDHLLRLARVSRGEVDRQALDLSTLARRIVDDHRERAPSRCVEFNIDANMRATGDPQLAAIILENLIQNALKFTSTQAVARIHIGQQQENGERVFFIADNGVGFDPAHAGNLFGVFQRLHSASEFPGTGIGLATVHRLVQRHRGRIWAHASVNAGATFFFTLGT